MKAKVLFSKEDVKIAKVESKIIVAKDLEGLQKIKEINKKLYEKTLEGQEIDRVVVNTAERKAKIICEKGIVNINFSDDEEMKKFIDVLLKREVYVYIDSEAIREILEFDRNIAISRVKEIKKYDLDESSELIVAKLDVGLELLPYSYKCKVVEYHASFDWVDESKYNIPERLYYILKKREVISENNKTYLIPRVGCIRRLIEDLENERKFIKIEKSERIEKSLWKQEEIEVKEYKVYLPLRISGGKVIEYKEPIVIEVWNDRIIIKRKDEVNSDVEVRVTINKAGWIEEQYTYNRRVYKEAWEDYDNEYVDDELLYTTLMYSAEDEKIKELYEKLLSLLD